MSEEAAPNRQPRRIACDRFAELLEGNVRQTVSRAVMHIDLQAKSKVHPLGKATKFLTPMACGQIDTSRLDRIKLFAIVNKLLRQGGKRLEIEMQRR